MKEEHDIRMIVDDTGIWCKWTKGDKVKTYSFMGQSGDYVEFVDRLLELAKLGLDPEDKKS